jgi:hypothetical protein
MAMQIVMTPTAHVKMSVLHVVMAPVNLHVEKLATLVHKIVENVVQAEVATAAQEDLQRYSLQSQQNCPWWKKKTKQ